MRNEVSALAVFVLLCGVCTETPDTLDVYQSSVKTLSANAIEQ